MIVSTKYVYDKGLIGEEVSGAFKTYHFDYRGSTIAITDASLRFILEAIINAPISIPGERSIIIRLILITC